jgi:S1-C subfamily serine protease
MIVNAPAVPGSSGGAVLNKKGELMGVIRGRFGFASSPDYTFKDHSGEFLIKSSRNRGKDLCVAVPVKKVAGIAEDLKKFGKVKRGWLGVTIDSSGDSKVWVSKVTKNSPANKAGIRVGDVILKVGQVPIKEPIHVTKAIRALKPGQKVKIECLRGKARETALVVLGELKDKKSTWSFKFPPDTVIPEIPKSLPNIENYVFRFVSSRTLGVDVMALTPELAKEFKIKEGSGIMISKVYEDTAAEKAGLRPADIIVKAGSKVIKKNTDLRKALISLKDKEPIVITLYRKGDLKKIKVVPDNNKKFGTTLERLQEKLKNINVTVEAEDRLKAAEMEQLRKEEEKWRQLQEKYLKEAELVRQKEIERYKEAVEAMKKEQEKMKEEMEKMKLMLEKEKQEKEKEKNKPTTM